MDNKANPEVVATKAPEFFNRFKDIPLKSGSFFTVRPLGLVPREEFKSRMMIISKYITAITDEEASIVESYSKIPYFKFCCDRVAELHGIPLDDVEETVLLSLILPTTEHPKAAIFDLNYPDESTYLTKEQLLERRKQEEEAKILKEEVTNFVVSMAASTLGVTESFKEMITAINTIPAFELTKVLEERGRQIKRAEREAKEKSSNKPSKVMMRKAKQQAQELMEGKLQQKENDKAPNVKPEEVKINLGQFM